MLSKGCYTRLAVEIDLALHLVLGSDLLLEGFDSPPFWQKFKFEHIHLFCRRCGRVGHRLIDCPSFLVVASLLQAANPPLKLSADVDMAPEADPMHVDDDLPPYAVDSCPTATEKP